MAKILVIDDSKFQRNAIVRQVKELGHEVVEAANGKEGMEIISQEFPSCVITDLHMPELDGTALIQEINTKAQGLKIIVMSADIQKGTKVKMQKNGAFAFISKPVKKNVLAEILAKALNSENT